jgi:hypothetical protein
MNFVQHQTMLGKDLAERLSQMHPYARAVLALEFTNGRTLARLTRAQAAKLTGESPYNLSIAAIATADEREGLMCGRLKLSDVRRAHAHHREMTDAEIIAYINRANPDRILVMLDQMTAPPQPMAAE